MLRRSEPRFIKLKSPREIGLMRDAGRVVAQSLDKVRQIAVPGATTADFDEAVTAVFREYGATSLFRGYPNAAKGKPASAAFVRSSSPDSNG